MKPPVDWPGAINRFTELTQLKANLLDVPITGSWRVVDAIDRELTVVPNPNWLFLRPLVLAEQETN